MSVGVGTLLGTIVSNIQEERFSSVSGNLPEEKNNLDNQNVVLVKEHQEEIVTVTPISSSNEKYQVMIVKKRSNQVSISRFTSIIKIQRSAVNVLKFRALRNS